jgi:hypothetical protein
MKRVKITAKAYDQAIKFCNRRRKDMKLPPITKLPPGIANMPDSCPCANTCKDLIVLHSEWYWKNEASRQFSSPGKFTHEFDKKAEDLGEVLPIRGVK